MKKIFDTPVEHYVIIRGKKYKYTLDPQSKRLTQFVCEGAGISQRFLNSDIPALMVDLPELIIAEQEWLKKQKEEIIRFRVRAEEKEQIEQKAYKAGFKSVSAFLRSLALGA